MTTQIAGAPDATDQALVQMLTGAWVTQMAAAVAHLRIPDQLAAKQPQSIEQLATAVGADADALHRVMRALSSLGVFAEAGPREYVLTPLGTRLCAGQPGSMRDFFLAETDEVHRRSWDAVVNAIRTGQPQPPATVGMSVFDYYGKHPEAGEQFGLAMQSVSAMSAQGVLAAYDFTSARHIVDVGGGNGSFVRAVLTQHPHASGTVYDLPYIQGQASAIIEHEGLANRCRFEAGNFFESVPSGGDIYLLRFILHDWNDEQSRRVLSAVRAAMRPGSRLLVVEMLVPDQNEPGFVQFMDINMLVITGGRERTTAEFAKLFADSGLRLSRTIATGTPFHIVEGEVATS